LNISMWKVGGRLQYESQSLLSLKGHSERVSQALYIAVSAESVIVLESFLGSFRSFYGQNDPSDPKNDPRILPAGTQQL
jgi:hypothetical protein